MSFLCECPCSRSKEHMQESPDASISDRQDLVNQLQSEAPNHQEGYPLLMKDMNAASFSLDANSYEIQTIVGRGCMGAATISAAKHRPTGQLIAIKRTCLDHKNIELEEIQHEVLLTRQLNHKNLLQYLCAFMFNGEVWIVMPYMAYGSARDLLKYPFSQGMPELLVAFALSGVLHALEYIHKRGIIHRSVKGSHIMFSAKGQVCLTGLRYCYDLMDSGSGCFSKTVHEFSPNTVCNLNWLSPEVLGQNLLGYNNKSDVYSVGITACELANGAVPFAHMPPTQMLVEKLQGPTPLLLDATTCKLLENAEQQSGEIEGLPNYFKQKLFTEGFHQIVAICLEKDPFLRPNVTQLLNHAFFKQCRRSNISLCNLLHSLVPRAENVDQNQLGSGISCPVVDEVSEKLGDITVDDDGWNF